MAQPEQLSLSWDAHQKSICNGLSVLQQRGEFVDMTLAADGHHVKVHKMVLSLVSPYIKDLISTAECSHPVIFLNNISYNTLCAILGYIYTGEVVVPKHQLSDLIAAGKALHIRGLREMDDEKTTESITAANASLRSVPNMEKSKTQKVKKKIMLPKKDKDTAPIPTCEIFLDESNTIHEETALDIQDSMEIEDDSTVICETSLDNSETLNNSNNDQSDIKHDLTPEQTKDALLSQKLQYSVSIQGGLQVIHNRYIYHLRYFGKKNRKRFWRCVDYSSNLKCPANIGTDENNVVTERSFTHNHGFHDNKIIKKLRAGKVYSVFHEAESQAGRKKKDRRVPFD